MNKKEFTRSVAELLRDNNIRKPVSATKQVFHISDDEGNSKDFTLSKTNKTVAYTNSDVEVIVDACLNIIQDALKRGEPVTIQGFGSLGLNYRQPRTTKLVGTDEDVYIEGRYVPKFTFGNDLRMCAKLYELSLNEKPEELSPTYDDETEAEGGE